jgi:inosose dehydratase
MTAPMQLGYAVNQWKPNFDDFTRKEQHIRAFKVLVAAGFTGIELRSGTGRWDPLGRPASIAANYGSIDGFVQLLNDLGIEAVTSWFFDPEAPIDEELSRGRSILNSDDHAAIVATCRELAEFLEVACGRRIVVRALPAAWRHGSLSPVDVAVAAAGWNRVGRAVAEHGVRVSLHADVLSAAADDDVLGQLLGDTDEAVVGLTIDTAELTLAGLDVLDIFQRYAERVDHIQLKDTRYVDSAAERFGPHAERALLQEGGRREVERWFYECGTPGGLVDFPGLVASLNRNGYSGWLIFESDQSPNPATSVMLNAWYAQHRLGFRRDRRV